MKRTLLTLIFLMISFIQVAMARQVIFIPGAASSADLVHFKYSTGALKLINHSEYFKYYLNSKELAKYNPLVCPKEFDNDSRSLLERALDCQKFILKENLCEEKITLVGHSMGGLVARILASRSRVRHCIDSVITLSTPHRGTFLANGILSPENDHQVVKALAKTFDFTPTQKRYILELLVSKKNQLRFFPYPNNSKVKYFSISNFKNNFVHFPLYLTSKVIKDEMKKRNLELGLDNDGIVPTFSMKFGQHLKTIHADHVDTACILTGSLTKGCKQTHDLLVSTLEKL